MVQDPLVVRRNEFITDIDMTTCDLPIQSTDTAILTSRVGRIVFHSDHPSKGSHLEYYPGMPVLLGLGLIRLR
jgi:hypothetical protein